ncbi:MAG: hypothetical protein V7765_11525 [Oleispira sp.]
MRFFFALSILCVFTLVFFWQPDSQLAFWQDGLSPSEFSQVEAKNGALNSYNTSAQNPLTEQSGALLADKRDDIIEDFIPNPKTVASLRQARLEGDPRTPNLAPNHEREKPSAEELGDHDQYVEYEKRQQKRVYRAYVEASKIKTAQLRSMIERGKAEGVSAEEIAFAEEKIRGIEEMAITLQQDHPDIMEDSYQPPADWLIESLGQDDNSIKSDESDANIAQ